MICFEVSLNGEVLCTTGTSQGFLDFDLRRICMPNWNETELNLRETICRPPSTGDDLAPKIREALQQPERPASTQSVYWIDRKQLKPGDAITIKLVEVPVDHPAPPPPRQANSN